LSQAGFGSPVAESLKLYLANRRALGRCFTKEENILRRWDKFLQEQFPHQHRIRPDMFHDWTKTMPYLTPNIRRSNLMIVRNFLRFHVRSHPNTYVPDPVTFPKRCPYRLPRLVTPEEMAQVLATAKQLHTFNTSPVRAQTVHLALALLFCCGLRRSELLRLRLRHFDSHEKVLRIEQTKFHKSRLVPLSRSVARLVDQYLVLRKRLRLPTQPDSPLIWSKRHLAPTGEVCASTLVESWHQLCLAVGVLDERGRPPHLHDLRHSFAVVALHRWYQQGLDVPAKLPHLATYLGHVGAASTQHYLHLTPDLREAASQRFHRFAPDILGNGGGQ
jgi:integrase